MNQYKAKIIGTPSGVKSKKNGGGTFVTVAVQILEGPAKGMEVLANRTLNSVVVDAQGNAIPHPTTGQRQFKAKEMPALNAEITLTHTCIASTAPATLGQPFHFFEIGTGVTVVAQAVLTSVLGGIGGVAPQAPVAQPAALAGAQTAPMPVAAPPVAEIVTPVAAQQPAGGL